MRRGTTLFNVNPNKMSKKIEFIQLDHSDQWENPNSGIVVHTAWADVRFRSSAEAGGDFVTNRKVISVVCYYKDAITEDLAIRYQGKLYNITSILPDDYGKGMLITGEVQV